MANPIIHSESSMKKFNGTTKEDFDKFLAIHEKMDCSKAWVSDNRHRVLTHTLFWVKEVMIPIFGSYIVLSNEKKISVKDICELHILEDYKMKFIPTPQDFIQGMDFKPWMQNGINGVCPSAEKLYPQLSQEDKKDNGTGGTSSGPWDQRHRLMD
jgi:hypothetical protein